MALTAQNSTSRSLYTGLAKARVAAINPTMAELNAMGIPAQQEPEYLKKVMTDKGELRKLRVEVHFETVASPLIPAGIRARLSLFTSFSYVGNMQMNNFSRFLNFATAGDEQKKEFNASAWQKPVYDGEMDLMLLLEQLLNPKRGTDFYLDQREQLFYNGDTRELQMWLAEANSRKNYVQLMLGVQTDKEGRNYQTCFKKVLASWVTKYDKFHEQLMKQMNYQLDTDFGPVGMQYSADSYKPREWYADGETATPVPVAAGTMPATPPATAGQPIVGGPLAAAASAGVTNQIATGAPRFGARGQVVKWAPGDYTSGTADPMSADYNPEFDPDLPF